MGHACLWRGPESGLLILQSAVAHRELKDAIEKSPMCLVSRLGWEDRMWDLWHDETAPFVSRHTQKCVTMTHPQK